MKRIEYTYLEKIYQTEKEVWDKCYEDVTAKEVFDVLVKTTSKTDIIEAIAFGNYSMYEEAFEKAVQERFYEWTIMDEYDDGEED